MLAIFTHPICATPHETNHSVTKQTRFDKHKVNNAQSMRSQGKSLFTCYTRNYRNLMFHILGIQNYRVEDKNTHVRQLNDKNK